MLRLPTLAVFAVLTSNDKIDGEQLFYPNADDPNA
jgi:hypothetical protein